MDIQSVTRKIVIVINGVEHIRYEDDFTESIHSAQKEGVRIETNEDVFEWIESI